MNLHYAQSEIRAIIKEGVFQGKAAYQKLPRVAEDWLQLRAEIEQLQGIVLKIRQAAHGPYTYATAVGRIKIIAAEAKGA